MTHAAPPPVTQEADHLASAARHAFWRRILALGIDLLVLSLVDAVINTVYGVTHVTSGSLILTAGNDFATWPSSTDVGGGWLTLIWQLYFLGLEALFGATVGKGIVGLRVTDRMGRRPALWRLLVRNIVRIVDGFPVVYLLGGCVAWLSPWRQRLGDLFADTLVLPREAVAEPRLAPAARSWRLTLASFVLLAGLAYSAIFFYYGRPPLVVQGMMNTRQDMFQDGVSAYTLSAPTWGSNVVTYNISYTTEHPVDTCLASLTLTWSFPAGWQARDGEAFCARHTP